jgi:hypothetical protein
MGTIVCYKDNLPHSIIEWSYDDDRMLARASRPDGDSLALFAWWQETAEAIAR